MTDRSPTGTPGAGLGGASASTRPLARAPERRARFSTISDAESTGCTGRGLAPDGAGRPRPTRRPSRRAAPSAGDAGRWDAFDPAPRHRLARRAAVHARHPPDRLPQPALDDAHVRRASARPRTRTPASASCSPPARPACRSPTTCRRCTATTPTTPRPRASSGRAASAVSSLADMEVLLDGLPLERVSTSMTINSPAAPIWAMYIVAAEKAGVPRDRARGHDPERHPQGVRRPEGVPVPARAVDAPRHRHDRVRDARAAALEHGLDQRLPHPRGGLDRGPGAGVHDRRRDGLRRGRASSAACASTTSRRGCRFFFNSHTDFFEEIAKFRASRRIWYEAHDRALRRRERALDLDALPHPDRRRVADARSSRSTT